MTTTTEGTLPPHLSPFFTNHAASSAYRITLSAHEHTWTEDEQRAMAEAIVRLDAERIELRAKIAKLEANIEQYADECVKCKLRQLEEEKRS